MIKTFITTFLVIGIGGSLGYGSHVAVESIKPLPVPALKLDLPAVSGANSAKPGDVVILTPDNIDDARVAWVTFDAGFKVSRKARDVVKTESGSIEFESVPAHSLFIIIPDGVEQVRIACVVTPNNPSADQTTIVHVIDVDRESSEDPEPVDPPDPIPSSLTKTDFLVFVGESGERSQEHAVILNGKFWLKELGDAGYNRPLVYDDDTDEGKKFVIAANRMSNVDAPFFAIMSSDGKFVKAFKANTVGELKEQIQWQ